MAGDWIKMRHCLHTAPEVVRISSALKADRLRVLGALFVLWCVADEHADDDGRLAGYSPEAVDGIVGWPGFAAAVAAAGWLTIEPKSLVFPNFDYHNGATAKRRAQDAARKRSVRKVSASDADKKRTREEKRREEERRVPGPIPPPISETETKPKDNGRVSAADDGAGTGRAKALMALGFEAHEAAAAVAKYTPARIDQVIAAVKAKSPDNPVAFAVTWLRKSRDDEKTESGRIAAKLDNARRSARDSRRIK